MNKKIRVLEFELYYKTGGIESFLLNLYREIDRESIEFHLVSSYMHPENEDEFLELGGKVYTISNPKCFISYLKSIDYLMKQGFDVAHMNKCSAVNVFPVLLAYKNHIPVIVHSHNSMSRLGRLAIPIQVLNRMILTKISKINLSCSDVAGHWMFGNRRYEIIRNGILIDKYKYSTERMERKKEELRIPRNALIFTNLGDLRKQKNPLFLIDVFFEMTKLIDCYLLVIGDGVLRKEVEDKIAKFRITEKVILLGKRNDVPDLLTCVDGLIMPSLFEGLPMSCIEAQASGVRLFLSDKISKEVELTQHVDWFSLGDSPKEIAKKIIGKSKNKLSATERLDDNYVVRQKGFDMKETAQKMKDIYLKIYERKK